jgi:hypothetical protein
MLFTVLTITLYRTAMCSNLSLSFLNVIIRVCKVGFSSLRLVFLTRPRVRSMAGSCLTILYSSHAQGVVALCLPKLQIDVTPLH